MTSAETFRGLHRRGEPLVMPNAWDAGSARILAGAGFGALATTSSGAAAARGRDDGELSRDVVIAHAAELVAAVGVPVSADLEDGYGEDPSEVAETIERAVDAGLAGASIEDWGATGIRDREVAVARVEAAVRAAAGRLVLTARAENLIRGVDDLGDTLRRLEAYAGAGADVAFAPGLRGSDAIETAVRRVPVPLSVLVVPGVPPVATLAQLGVARVSVGGALAFAAYGGLARTARELRDAGTYGFLELAREGRSATEEAFSASEG